MFKPLSTSALNLPEIVETISIKYAVPAIGVLLQKNADFVQLVVGRRSMQAPAAAQAGDKFHFGSCGKALTSALIHSLIEQNILAHDDNVQNILQEKNKKINLHPVCSKITLLQLLTHTSGLVPNAPDLMELHQQSRQLSPREIRAQLMQKILAQAPLTAPGKQYAYSNIGYILLGYIAEEVLDCPYEELVQRFIFNACGMKTAGFGAVDNKAAAAPQNTWGHTTNQGKYQPVAFDNPTAYAPAGTMHASLTDWMNFIASIKPKFNAAKSPTMLRSAPMGNGNFYTELAFIQSTLNGRPFYSHDGSNTLNYCRVTFFPDVDCTLIITVNAGDANAEDAVDALTTELQKLLVLQKLPLKPQREATKLIS